MATEDAQAEPAAVAPEQGRQARLAEMVEKLAHMFPKVAPSSALKGVRGTLLNNGYSPFMRPARQRRPGCSLRGALAAPSPFFLSGAGGVCHSARAQGDAGRPLQEGCRC